MSTSTTVRELKFIFSRTVQSKCSVEIWRTTQTNILTYVVFECVTHLYRRMLRNTQHALRARTQVAQSLPKILKDTVKSIIIDSEVVAWDPEKKRILPFQILSTRKKKTESVKDVKIQVLIVAFDLLLLNGESMLGKTFRERRAKLRESLRETNGIIRFAESYDVDLSSSDDSENKESDSTQDMEEVGRLSSVGASRWAHRAGRIIVGHGTKESAMGHPAE